MLSLPFSSLLILYLFQQGTAIEKTLSLQKSLKKTLKGSYLAVYTIKKIMFIFLTFPDQALKKKELTVKPVPFLEGGVQSPYFVSTPFPSYSSIRICFNSLINGSLGLAVVH